jgi:hypothetical protein
MTVKAMCPMALAMFPMDSQTCKLGLESYGYDVDDIGMVLNKESSPRVSFHSFDRFQLILLSLCPKGIALMQSGQNPFSDYYWGERRSDGKKPEDAVAFDDFFLPQFRRTGYRVIDLKL